MTDFSAERPCRILCLDGGGSMGFYSIGVLKGLEGMLRRPLHERLDLVFGTSTGSILAALICLGHSVDEIHELYRTHVVRVMGKRLPCSKSRALAKVAATVLGERTFNDVQTQVGIVATSWDSETPLIFKSSSALAHGGHEGFVPGFGCTISDAVQASCSAYPFFRRKRLNLANGQRVLAADGGYCANDPTLYAIADATEAFGVARDHIRVVSIGVGRYPAPRRFDTLGYWLGYLFTVRLLQKVLEINTKSMNQLRLVLFGEVPTVRISDAYNDPELATDLFETDLAKLDRLYQRGQASFRKYESRLVTFF